MNELYTSWMHEESVRARSRITMTNNGFASRISYNRILLRTLNLYIYSSSLSSHSHNGVLSHSEALCLLFTSFLQVSHSPSPRRFRFPPLLQRPRR